MNKHPFHDGLIKVLAMPIIILGAGFIYIGMEHASELSSGWQLLPFFGMAVISVTVITVLAVSRMGKDD